MCRCHMHGTIITAEITRIAHFFAGTDCHPRATCLASMFIGYLACAFAMQTPLRANGVASFYYLGPSRSVRDPFWAAFVPTLRICSQAWPAQSSGWRASGG